MRQQLLLEKAVVVFEKGERLDLGWMDTLGLRKNESCKLEFERYIVFFL